MNPNVLIEAAEIDRRRQADEKLGKLAGVPIVIKEAVDTVGFPTTFGWEPLAKKAGGIELIPTRDAPIVTRLKAADAIILGKTNIPAFSFAFSANTSWDGPTYNAVNRSLTPGGSSSGTATAVSGNMAVLGIAEETAGSIQVPAAAQSLVGIKPSFGLIPSTGITPLAGSTKDVVGPHARTVWDAAILLDVIAGFSADDHKTISAKVPDGGYTSFLKENPLKGKRLGLYGPGWKSDEPTAETKKLYDQAIKVLKSQGAELIDDPFAGTGLAEYMKTQKFFLGMESFFYDLEKYFNNLDPADNELTIEKVFQRAGRVPWTEGDALGTLLNRMDVEKAIAHSKELPDLTEFNNVKNELLRIIIHVLDEHQLDGFVYPTLLEPIPELQEKNIAASTISEINISGLPLITLPAGYYENGSPFALAFWGRMWSEGDLIGMGFGYEQVARGRRTPQLLESV
ncbi:amidase/aspartyl-tRNA(Asn)/glutamyl-tRNA(Gln) amidotransferase subunit A [Cytobacillus purgationiresistens]|uniref:Amidase/aspartyl-tRNA(Asn)/glutamyl-tRNA(Gln) amidotransferase subunit A n=2 Tax=Cytobacillus purgationiresistens TaxID=863449 RepID=A0ABU0AD27_9BACI|nr:amidase/aspartyl-tRNA(Asn)/glutamyl-tRNA(Gln) amidotransferase subunit A [Cytobacillus purgationiresistens]